MTIVKPSKKLSSQQSRKKHFPFGNKILLTLFPSVLIALLLGTYLDLYFVGKGLYSFPKRPFPDIFSIHIGFTLIILPIFTVLFLVICYKINLWAKCGLIFILSIFMSVVEKLAEFIGLFVHLDSWKHMYSFIGYNLYLMMIYFVYHCLNEYVMKDK